MSKDVSVSFMIDRGTNQILIGAMAQTNKSLDETFVAALVLYSRLQSLKKMGYLIQSYNYKNGAIQDIVL